MLNIKISNMNIDLGKYSDSSLKMAFCLLCIQRKERKCNRYYMVIVAGANRCLDILMSIYECYLCSPAKVHLYKKCWDFL